MTRRGWAAGVVLAGTVTFLAWQNHALSEQLGELHARIDRAQQTPPGPSAALASCLLGPQLARQVASELRNELPAAAAVAPSPGSIASVADEPAAPAATESGESANRVLDDILGRGRMTPDDLNALREELATATTQERDDVRARISAALNRDELVADDPHALFP